MKESTFSWTSIVGGTWCVILPDHLNNITLASGSDLRKPDKIMRWVQDITARIFARWSFNPGQANPVGDGMSRDPKDRDQVRGEDGEDGGVPRNASLPRTLKEAFELARAQCEDRRSTLKGLAWDPKPFCRDLVQ